MTPEVSFKSILIVMLVIGAYFAGEVPEQHRARVAESKARIEAERALLIEQDARMMAEQLRLQAEQAVQQANETQARLIAEIAELASDKSN